MREIHALLSSILAVALTAGQTPTQAGAGGATAGRSSRVQRIAEQVDALVGDLQELDLSPAGDGLLEFLGTRDAAGRRVQGFVNDLLRELAPTEHLGIDHVRFDADTAPRLTGRIVVAEPGDTFGRVRSGDTVLLRAGVHRIPRAEWSDVAFVGSSRSACVVHCSLDQAMRVRFQNLTIDCRDQPFLDLRGRGAVQLRDCDVGKYNSGAGGSNAIYASGSVILVERCVFDGLEGRARASGRYGNAFDLRGSHALWVRESNFPNQEIVHRATALAVFDRCSVEGARIGVMPGSGELFVRDSRVVQRVGGPAGVDFRIATDDRAFVQYLVGGGDEVDERSRTAAEELRLDRDLRYWGTLRRHADPEIRAAAIGRLGSLLRRELPKFATEADDPAVLPQPLRSGFADEVWSGRFLEWLDVAGPSLVWDADAGCYRRR